MESGYRREVSLRRFVVRHTDSFSVAMIGRAGLSSALTDRVPREVNDAIALLRNGNPEDIQQRRDRVITAGEKKGDPRCPGHRTRQRPPHRAHHRRGAPPSAAWQSAVRPAPLHQIIGFIYLTQRANRILRQTSPPGVIV